MSHEIWVAQANEKKIVFVGDKRALAAGKIDGKAHAPLAEIIAESEGQVLHVVDGYKAQQMVTSEGFKELRPQQPTACPSAPTPPSPIKPIQDRKFRLS